jgi:hypothetical protein
MREWREIVKDLEAVHDEMKKWFSHLGRESARKEFNKLAKKDAELEKELSESLAERYKMK